MMASKILSRYLPGAEGGTEGAVHYDESPERRLEAGRLQEDGHQLYSDSADEHELKNMLAEATSEPTSPETAALLTEGPTSRTHRAPPGINTRGKWMARTHGGQQEEDEDVPESLLMEGRGGHDRGLEESDIGRQPPAASHTEQQWRLAQEQQRLHLDDHGSPRRTPNPRHATGRTYTNPKEQALWRWTNVQNVDAFLMEVYQYYVEHGIWSICLSRAIYLLTTVFLFACFMLLSTCVDYSKIPSSKGTSEVLIPKCMQNASFGKNVLLWLVTFWWLSTLFAYVMDVRRLWNLHEFYHHLLGISDVDIQTIPWERVVEGLMNLRDANPETAETGTANRRFLQDHTGQVQSKQRMDAHDIANRLMRRDNYFIALFDQEVLDLTVNIPFLGERRFYSKTLEWFLYFCFMNFIFNEQGHIQSICLDAKYRHKLIQHLQRRMRFAAVISIFMAPFNISAQCIYYFSRYYAEFRNNPSQLAAREFTPYAEWKFREYNELDHDFRRRMRMAYPFADQYLNQFPKDKTNQALQFVSLISGTIVAVLGIATLLDSELFLGFEVTPGRTAFFYLSVCTAIYIATRNAVPDDSEVHEPVMHLIEVVSYTHYCPPHWEKQLHSNDVRTEFASLYNMKILVYLAEISSLILAPFILWRNSGERTARILDFFRDHTVHVDGLGHLCTEAVFSFRKNKRAGDADPAKDVEGLRADYFGNKDDKMAKSQYYFMQRLGQYDQQQASRYAHRPYHAMQMPPSFPPLSPLREAAGKATAKRSVSRQHYASPRMAPRSSSPQQSMLLDVPIHSPVLAPRGRHPPSTRHPRSRRAKEEDLGPTPFEEMTTSKLIEDDAGLDDSWKTFTQRFPDGQEMDDTRNDRRQDNGVLGLLMQYSKAQAGPNRGHGV